MAARRTMTRRSLVAGGLGSAAGVVVVGAGMAAGVLPGRARLKAQYHDWFSHTRAYWDSVTLPAFAFAGAALGQAAGT